MIAKKISKVLSQQTTRVKSVDFHPVKPIFIIGLHDGRIQAWDYNANACIYEFLDDNTVEKGSVRSVCFHPHGDFFVSCGDDKIIRMWDYTKRKLLKIFKGHSDFVRSVDFHPTKPWIISSSDDQTIKIWNFMTGKCMATATGHSHYVMSAKFLDENLIISGSLDNTIRIWDCKNLLEKTNKFVPDIIVKQIVQGHDRGINFINICNDNDDIVILSGGDDREIKIWEYRNELLERESILSHQGCVSYALLHQNNIVSVGEDGQFSIYDLKTKKYNKYFVEGRFWSLAGKNGIFICGHDNGFEILEYIEPKLISNTSKGCYYLKNTHFYYSDLSSEKKVCKAEGDVISIHSFDKYLLIQYQTKYEIYEQNKKIYKDDGFGILLDDNEILIVKKKGSTFTIKNLEGSIINSFEVFDGSLIFGDKNTFFVSKNNVIARCTKDGLSDTLSIGFSCDKVFVSNSREFYAFLSKNKIAIYDSNMNLINYENEIVNIRSGFFYDDIFIYSTMKHLKYIFAEQGVIISVDSLMYPFYYDNNLIYFLSDEGIESIEVDITEINFKNLVINNNDLQDITSIIESGSLPGLSPLSFLIRKHKGDIALPYIKNDMQRFELCLSTGKLEECLEYCKKSDDHQMYKRLSVVALESTNFSISEECLLYLQEWYEVFLLYVCSNKFERVERCLEVCDEYTRKIVKLYLEDSEYFNININEEKIKSLDINEEKIKSLDINEEKIKSLDIKENNIKADNINKDNIKEKIESLDIKDEIKGDEVKYTIFSKELLNAISFTPVNVKNAYQGGLDFVTKGNFSSALEIFRNCLFSLSKSCNTKDYKSELRKSIGSYISGLNIQLLRKKEEDSKKQIIYAWYFSTLELITEHKRLAKQELISVCLKNGNYLQAKDVAESFIEESKPKIVKKALKLENPENQYVIPDGVFCYDIKDIKESSKECLYCYVKSSSGEICTLCGIGYLKN